MSHTIEPATTSRSKCRACGVKIDKDELRFGERLPNPFGDEGSETTHWYHPLCGAYRRPDSFSEILKELPAGADVDAGRLKEAVAFGIKHPRVERINIVERASSGRARCRHCREAISKDGWRIGLVYFQEGAANPAGFIHVDCAGDYFETTELLDRLRHFGTGLNDGDIADLENVLRSTG